ncbi:tRNA epoxyqueuosine(34) reductase QueG [Geothrix fuzhouensis]|uniref:tRNA epoxyqueuosine(34) reductase QueG n=1 Tax=Geothrix fuzhouensis TaxID=2966451 RepID=UPI0021494EDC|nr:tRNA epoxyqueuosine(34) reductase QueG [Geothrix fuzhouensis]
MVLGGGVHVPAEHPDPLPFKAWLRSEALAAGFARVGFSGCDPFQAEEDQLRTWFQEGRGTLLPYLDPATLLDPRALWPQARTALVGFFPYGRPEAVPGSAPGSLKLSRYLWGPDYHMLLKPRLARLLEAAQAWWPGLEGRVCVDTAPLLERQLAVRAGLGWQGKHTLLIAGKGGSWGFLGVLLLSLELPPDKPFGTQQCGTCTACLEACPSGALTPFRLDPSRCLTTYTIETEAEPPPEVAAALAESRWAAGCDACQEVCPWNRAPLWGDPALWGGSSPLHTRSAEDLPRGAAQWRKLTRRTALRRVRDRHWRATLARILDS